MKEILGSTFYTIDEIAEQIQETTQVVKNYLKSSKLNGQRIGHHLYISSLSLQGFLEPPSPVIIDPEFTRRATTFLNRYRKKTSVAWSPTERNENALGWKDTLEWKGPALQQALQQWQKTPTMKAKIAVLEAMCTILELRGAGPRSYSKNQVNYKKVYLKGADFSVLPLGGIFEQAYLEGANFRQALLSSTFSGAYLKGADFRQASGRGTIFREAYLKGANFSQALFYQADFTDANLKEAIFEGAQLSKCKFQGAKAYLSQKEAFSRVLSGEQIDSMLWLNEKAKEVEDKQVEIPEVIKPRGYSITDTAKMLGISPQTVRNYIKRDKLKGHYRPRSVYITEESLTHYLFGRRYSNITEQIRRGTLSSPWPGRAGNYQKFGNDFRLNIIEVARFLRITPERVRYHIKRKNLTSKASPRGFYVSEQSLWNFLHPGTPTLSDHEFTERASVFLNMLNISTIIDSRIYIEPPVAAYKLMPKMLEAFDRASKLEVGLYNWKKAPTLPAKIRVLEAMTAILEAFFLGEDLREENFQGAYLKGIDLREAKLEGTNLQEVNLEEANLELADLKKVNLKGGNLRKANLYGVNLKGANLQDANFREIVIEDGCIGFEGVNLEGANFEGAHLRSVAFIDVNLEKANFRGANLDLASFEESYLIDTNFQGASIEKTVFKGALAYLSQKEAYSKIMTEEQINGIMWIKRSEA